MKNILFLFLTLVGISACHKDSDTLYDSTGVATKLPSLWNTPISDDGKLLKSKRIPN